MFTHLVCIGFWKSVSNVLFHLHKLTSDHNFVSQFSASLTPKPHLVKLTFQACANSIALIARKLSQDEKFLSPFAKNARANGFVNVVGGKEDDVTVILASVSLITNHQTSTAASSTDSDQPLTWWKYYWSERRDIRLHFVLDSW